MKNSESKYEIWPEVDEYDIKLDKNSDEVYCNAIRLFSDASRISLNIFS